MLEEPYLRYRIRSTEYLAEKLVARRRADRPARRAGTRSTSTRARCCRTSRRSQYPGIALVNALYLEAGVRGVEIGTVMFGLPARRHARRAAAMDLVRLAIPRRVYTQSHIDYVAEAVIGVAGMKDELRGYRIASGAEGPAPLHRRIRAAVEKGGAFRAPPSTDRASENAQNMNFTLNWPCVRALNRSCCP